MSAYGEMTVNFLKGDSIVQTDFVPPLNDAMSPGSSSE
jgi:hypothetical protein